jgi:hypothetical protein
MITIKPGTDVRGGVRLERSMETLTKRCYAIEKKPSY